MLKFFVLACALCAIQAMVLPELEGDCGKPAIEPVISLIVGGKEAEPHTWPWMTQVLKDGRHYCGATLIDKDWIVSAAHCFGKDPVVRAYTFALGVHNKEKNELSRMEYSAAEIIVHPNYKPLTTTNDIALIKVKQSVQYNENISPACLVSKRPDPETMAYVTGWGALRSNGRSPDELQQVNVPIVDHNTCEQSYSNLDEAAMMCAGYPEGGKDSCQGDSGGPMVVKGATWELAGIVSWGQGCAAPNYYGVYTNVANYLEWISNTMAGN